MQKGKKIFTILVALALVLAGVPVTTAVAGDTPPAALAATSQYFTVTIGGEPTAGGGYPAGSEVYIGNISNLLSRDFRYTTDGSDPVSGTEVTDPYNVLVPINSFIQLRVAYKEDGDYHDSGIDYLFTPTDTPYRAVNNSLHELYPAGYAPAPELTQNTYRFDGTDPGIADTVYTEAGKGWGVVDYGALGASIQYQKRSGSFLLKYTPPPDGGNTATAKTTRQMMFGTPAAEMGLSFWLWQDGNYDDGDGVAFTLYGPGGVEEKIPLFFTAKGAEGWKQYFIDLHDYWRADGYGLHRMGFAIEGRGGKNLYVDDVGAVKMVNSRVDLTAPESVSKGRIFLGETVDLSGQFVSISIPSGAGEVPYDDIFSGATSVSSKEYSGKEEQTLVMRSQSADVTPTKGAVSLFEVPRLSARPPRLFVQSGGAPPEEKESNPQSLEELGIGDTITLKTDDHTVPDADGQTGSNVDIYYTLDGSDVLDAAGQPVVGVAKKYTGFITYSGGYLHLKAAAVKPAATLDSNTTYWQPSEEQEWRFDLPRAATVTASPGAGTVEPGDKVTLDCTTPGAAIYYSTNGTTPTKASPGLRYTGPLTIEENTTLTAVAWANGSSESNAATFRYTLPGGGDIFEPNDGAATASPLSFPFQVEATLHRAPDVDYYAFDFPGGRLEARLAQPNTEQAGAHPYELTLLDKNGGVAAAGSGSPNRTITGEMPAGRYYLVVRGAAGAPAATFGTAPYTLSVSRLAAEGLDFSEMNLVTAMNHPNAPASYTIPGGLNGGGLPTMSLAYLARWSGPVLEEQDPYTVVKTTDPADLGSLVFDDAAMPYHAIAPQYHLSEGVMISLSDPANDLAERESLKQALYTHGALNISYLNAFPAYNGANYYLPSAVADQLSLGGHAVTLVGWDDNYAAGNFMVSINGANYTPPGDGAWIFKNSWGESEGDGGYFYASYYCYAFPFSASYYELESELNYNAIYQYDLLGATDTKPLLGEENQNYAYMKNVFTAEKGEALRAVGFYTMDVRQQYDVYIEQNGVRQHVAGGLMADSGYHTLRLSQDVPLAAGKDFAVIVRLESTGDAPLLVPGEYLGAEFNKVVLQTGKSFLSVDGTRWTDMTLPPYGGNACIKAFAYSSLIPAGSVAYHGADMPDITDTLPNRPPLVDDPTTSLDNTGLGAGQSSFDNLPQSSFPAASISLPASFDLRQIGAVTPVKNQGDLGSCWTFATFGSAESIFMRNNNIAYAYPSSLYLERSSATLDLAAGDPVFSLAATVQAPDAIGTNLVYWSVEGGVDAVEMQTYVSGSGARAPLLRALGTGKVRLTATSAADTTKSASMELTVVNSGLNPGDSTPVLPPFVVLFASVAAIATLAVLRRRSQKSPG